MALFSQRPVEVPAEVVMVCTGNICRSAYAEKALYSALTDRGNPWGLEVSSAGVYGLERAPMDPDTATVASVRGFDTSHRSQRLRIRRIESGGLFLTMTLEHRDQLLERSPSALQRAYTLAEFSQAVELLSHENSPQNWPENLGELLTALRPLRSRINLTETDDVADPYTQGIQAHHRAADQIDQLLAPISRILSDGPAAQPSTAR